MKRLPYARLTPPSWLRLPHRTARLRLATLFGALVLFSGFALVATTYVLFERATAVTTPHLPKVPHAPAIKNLSLPSSPFASGLSVPPHGPTAQALSRLQQEVNIDLTNEYKLTHAPPPIGASAGKGPRLTLLPESRQLTRDQHQLTQSERQLSRALHQLALAVHQVTRTGSVQAAQRASDLHQLLVDSGIALGVVAVLALLAGWLVAGRTLRPIRTITRTARRISSTSLHERLALDGPHDELRELGDTLDDLFARLEAAFEAQRRFVANASHELRTPITRERTLMQVALGDPSTSSDVWRSTGQKLLASNRGQETLIDALLTLASSERGLDQRERIDLADICQTAPARPDLDNEQLGLQIERTLRPAPIDGDPRLIERLVANLVDNAVAHNIAGGRVHIFTDTTDGQGVLTVINTGPVLRSVDIDRLFQPFQRLDPHRTHKNGHGLGLSIVRAIATAHHATVTADPLVEGGLSVTVAFPPSKIGSNGTSQNAAPRRQPDETLPNSPHRQP